MFVLFLLYQIWANIQEQDLPSRMQFDVSNTKHWRPFFNNSFKRENSNWMSVQPNDLHYEVTRLEDVTVLEKYIYETLRDKIVKWREPHMTRWHWACQKRLQEIVKGYIDLTLI